VCTGGILADTKKLIRLYPIAYRYLEGDQKFGKYQWITAQIAKNEKDIRPESFKIKNDSIRLGKKLSSQDKWMERKKWILSDSNTFESLEHLQNESNNELISMGLIKPKKIENLIISEKSKTELTEAIDKKNFIMNQPDMFLEKYDLEILPEKFILHFVCNNENCNGHKISILDWEICELYRKLKDHADWKQKIREKIMNERFGKDNDTYLIMGNMAGRHHIFCILGFFWPPDIKQMSLF
jgi:hypothetical protein